MTKMAAKWIKIDTQFMTKTAEKPYPAWMKRIFGDNSAHGKII